MQRVYGSMITANTMILLNKYHGVLRWCWANVLALSIIMMINATFRWRDFFSLSSNCFFCDRMYVMHKYCSFIGITVTLMMHICDELTFGLSLFRKNDDMKRHIVSGLRTTYTHYIRTECEMMNSIFIQIILMRTTITNIITTTTKRLSFSSMIFKNAEKFEFSYQA